MLASVFVIFVLLFSAFANAQEPDTIPLYQSFTIVSKQLNETRVLNIFTPESYENNSDTLPVLYMLDGGIKEDFPHIATTIDKLIKAKNIPPIILVGIENTQRRRDLTGLTLVDADKKIAPVVGQSQNFRNFIKEELFAEINKRYRTTSIKAIIGESLAGLFIMETLLSDADMFDYYIAMDPSLWWNNAALVKSADAFHSNTFASPKKLWFAGSATKEIYVHTESLARIFKNKPIENLQYYYSPEPKEEHGTIFRATKEKALIWTLGHP